VPLPLPSFRTGPLLNLISGPTRVSGPRPDRTTPPPPPPPRGLSCPLPPWATFYPCVFFFFFRLRWIYEDFYSGAVRTQRTRPVFCSAAYRLLLASSSLLKYLWKYATCRRFFAIDKATRGPPRHPCTADRSRVFVFFFSPSSPPPGQICGRLAFFCKLTLLNLRVPVPFCSPLFFFLVSPLLCARVFLHGHST